MSRECQAVLVGGVFDEEGGRTSGYFRKFAEHLQSLLGASHCRVVNGGTYAGLCEELNRVSEVSHLFWFADVPNTLPKLIPQLKLRYPGLVLISSKNNRRQAYTREQLFARMVASQSHYLLEFTESPSGQLQGTILSSNGTALLEHCLDIATITAVFASVICPGEPQ